jgi:hypothetical protein
LTQAPWIVAAVVALVGAGGVGALLGVRATNRRTNAEAVKTNVEAEVTLGGGWQALWQSARADAEMYRKEVNELRERLVLVEQHDSECQERLAKLEAHAAPEAIERKVVSLLDSAIERREERGHGHAGRSHG